MSYKEALDLLGLNRHYTIAELKAAYRRLANEHHPDHGGSNEEMQKINAAKKLLEKKVATVSLENYKKLQLARILEEYFEGFDLINKEIKISKKCLDFYENNYIFYSTSLQVVSADWELLKIDIEEAHTKEDVDVAIGKFKEKVNEEYNKFIAQISQVLIKEIKYSRSLSKVKGRFQRVTKVAALISLGYEFYLKVKDEDKKYHLFIDDKRKKVDNYRRLIDQKLKKDSQEFKQAAQFYQRLFREQEPETFSSVYEEAVRFVSGVVGKQENADLLSRITGVKNHILNSFNSNSVADTFDDSRKKVELLSKIFAILSDVEKLVINESVLPLLEEVSFENLEDMSDVLGKISGQKQTFYIKKNFEGDNLCIYFAEFIDEMVILRTINLHNHDSKAPRYLLEERNVFDQDYLSAKELFNTGTLLNYQIADGRILYVCGPVVLCLVDDDHDRHLAFRQKKDIKAIIKRYPPLYDEQTLQEWLLNSESYEKGNNAGKRRK